MDTWEDVKEGILSRCKKDNAGGIVCWMPRDWLETLEDALMKPESLTGKEFPEGKKVQMQMADMPMMFKLSGDPNPKIELKLLAGSKEVDMVFPLLTLFINIFHLLLALDS